MWANPNDAAAPLGLPQPRPSHGFLGVTGAKKSGKRSWFYDVFYEENENLFILGGILVG